MSSTDRGRGSAPGNQKEPPSGEASAADPAEPFPDWLDRMQRARARHAAITRNLHTRCAHVPEPIDQGAAAVDGAVGAASSTGDAAGCSHSMSGRHSSMSSLTI